MRTYTFQLTCGTMFDVTGDNAKAAWIEAIEHLDDAGHIDQVVELTLVNIT